MLNFVLQYISHHRKQLVKFVCIGFGTFGVSFSCFQLFYKPFHLDYRIAISLAYALSVIFHFSLHRIFTFGATGQQMAGNAGKYVLMLLFNYVLTLIAAWFVVEVLKISPSFIVVGSTALTASTSFFIMKYFVFSSKEAR